MDIGSRGSYPSNSLSNFSAHGFVIDGVVCNSMEGFLQSLKFSNVDVQEQVCTLVGVKAKYRGKPKKWWTTQTLWWRGKEIDRHSDEYSDLISRAYDALSENSSFQRAILSTQNAVFTHSMGKNDASHTILTEREFCRNLHRVRDNLNRRDKL